MRIDSSGRVAGVRFIASPNFDARPPEARIELLVVHGIGLPPRRFGGDAVPRLFTNTLDCTEDPYYAGLVGLRVSSHFLIRRSGEIIQFVPCAARAWHAGVSNWHGRDRCNDFSIGVELEGADTLPYLEAQYRQLRRLAGLLADHYPITDIIGHADIAPGRKTDPGPAFDWAHFRAGMTAR